MKEKEKEEEKRREKFKPVQSQSKPITKQSKKSVVNMSDSREEVREKSSMQDNLKTAVAEKY